VAVYTHLTADDVAGFIAAYDRGAYVSHHGIAEGVENTNYLVVTAGGRFILTLFERRVAESDLPFFLGLMAHVSARGVVAPAPIPDRAGVTLKSLRGRPAVMITFLEGKARMRPTAEDCRKAGAALAHLHLAGADFPARRENSLGPDGWRRLQTATEKDAERCAPGLARLIVDALADVLAHWPTGLPQGAVHADLFPDNVFFSDDQVSGVIDFYFACTDQLAYDLAITLDSWCYLDRTWRADCARAMIDGYAYVRPLASEERAALRILMRGAALRFLLTRLYDWLNQVESAVVKVKDPLEYRDLLMFLNRADDAAIFGPAR